MSKLNSSLYKIENDHAVIVWGKKEQSTIDLINKLPVQKIYLCQQTHSNQLVKFNEKNENPCADAHYTDQSCRPLGILTADCLPIMISQPQMVFALHAGWRGLENKIIYNLAHFANPSTMKAYIGPHIGPNSYEVSQDVAEQIVNCCPQPFKEKILKPHPQKQNKFFVHLATLAKAQLLDVGLHEDHIFISPQDTYTETQWNSYRRDGEFAGRNISLIYLKPT